MADTIADAARVAFDTSDARGIQWRIKRVFSVRLVSEGRTYDVLSVEEGGAVSAVGDPERDGYAFGGWCTSQEKVDSDVSTFS